jgi:ubiquinone biosynthesis protein COQ9
MTEDATKIDRLLEAALQHVPFDGWTVGVLGRAAREAGLAAEDVAFLCPHGPIDLIDRWVVLSDEATVAEATARRTAGAGIRDSISAAVRHRLELVAPHREALRRALALQSQPAHAGRAVRQVYRTVDAVWHALGDGSTDFSFYTKRAILAGVYGATLLYWLNDTSEGQRATWDFLDRRLSDALKLGRAKVGFAGLAAHLPNPRRLFDRLGQLR